MKFSPIVSVKSLMLASVLTFGITGMANAQGYGQGDSMQQPSGSTSSGTSGGGSDYGTSGMSQPSRYDSSRTSGSSYGDSSQLKGTYQDMQLWGEDGTGGTGPKLKGRY
ncbi:MAG TPA: hypothetical protein VHB01_10570 [Nitrosospira sp.]|jgi:hypothetical protein|nr:hypothetical protein [Nitrosospira sp.]